MVTMPRPRPVISGGFIARLILPFVVPFVITLVLVLTVGERWPRTLVPGSGLKLAGLAATALTAWSLWRWQMRDVENEDLRRLTALICGLTGLMGWPVWCMGVLPSVNGAVLSDERSVMMTLERTERTYKSKSRDYYHWAWLTSAEPASPATSGRYFIPEGIYQTWNTGSSQRVTVNVARGLLGAEVVTGYEAQKAR